MATTETPSLIRALAEQLRGQPGDADVVFVLGVLARSPIAPDRAERVRLNALARGGGNRRAELLAEASHTLLDLV